MRNTQDIAIIASFMGGSPFIEGDNSGWWNTPKLAPHDYESICFDAIKYDCNWAWLMTVVDKIESLGRISVTIESSRCFIKDESYADLSTPMDNRFTGESDMFEEIWTSAKRGEGRLDVVFRAVVEFIKVYKKN